MANTKREIIRTVKFVLFSASAYGLYRAVFSDEEVMWQKEEEVV